MSRAHFEEQSRPESYRRNRGGSMKTYHAELTLHIDADTDTDAWRIMDGITRYIRDTHPDARPKHAGVYKEYKWRVDTAAGTINKQGEWREEV